MGIKNIKLEWIIVWVVAWMLLFAIIWLCFGFGAVTHTSFSLEGWLQLAVQVGALVLLFIIVFLKPRWIKDLVESQVKLLPQIPISKLNDGDSEVTYKEKIVTAFKEELMSLQEGFERHSGIIETAICEQTRSLRDILEQIRMELKRAADSDTPVVPKDTQ